MYPAGASGNGQWGKGKKSMARRGAVASKGGGKRGDAVDDKLDDLQRSTAFRRSDLDDKSAALLDVIAENQKSLSALAYLKDALVAVPRNQVRHWNRYIFVLLRNFDDISYEMYQERRDQRARSATRWSSRTSSGTNLTMSSTLSADAVEFVPGALTWQGRIQRATSRASTASSLVALPDERGDTESEDLGRSVVPAERTELPTHASRAESEVLPVDVNISEPQPIDTTTCDLGEETDHGQLASGSKIKHAFAIGVAVAAIALLLRRRR